MNETGKFLINAVSVLVIALVIARLLFVEVVTVSDNSMAPTLVYGDEVLVWKGAHVDMADVVVCKHPLYEGRKVISRAIAFAGHTVSTDHNGTLYVDGDQASTQLSGPISFYDETRQRPYRMQRGQVDYFGKHSHEFFIEEGNRMTLRTYHVEHGIYLLADNRSESSYDSRELGELDPSNCLGQVFLRYHAAPGNEELGHHPLDMIR